MWTTKAQSDQRLPVRNLGSLRYSTAPQPQQICFAQYKGTYPERDISPNWKK